MKQTNTYDDIECPYCGTLFNGREACNGDMDCHCVICPECNNHMTISMSIEYFAEETKEDTCGNCKKQTAGKIKAGQILKLLREGKYKGKDIAEKFNVSKSYVSKLKRKAGLIKYNELI